MKSTQILVSIIAALLVLSVVAFVIRRRRQAGPRIGPYSEIRAELLEQYENYPEPAVLAERPAGIDTRLSLDDGYAFEEQFRLHKQEPGSENEFFDRYIDILRSIWDELQAISTEYDALDLLSEPRRTVFVVDALIANVNNGGFDQYYINSSGNGAAMAPACFRRMGLADIAEIVERANSVFADSPSMLRQRRMKQIESLGEQSSALWEACDTDFFQRESDVLSNSAEYILRNRNEFFR